MANITPALVKELRERTGSGILSCKQALIKVGGNIELAIENMRKSGVIKAAKKKSDMTIEGIIKTRILKNYGIMLEVNCQTDFVSKNLEFQTFTNKILDVAIKKKITDINYLKDILEEERIALVLKIGENINIRRIAVLKNDFIGSYVHNMRIGALITVTKFNQELIKKISMHIIACKPEFIRPDDVSVNIIEKERQLQLEIAMKSGKPKHIAEQIVKGRMKKFIKTISLTTQPFIFNQHKIVQEILKENDIDINQFIRFEIGEHL
ncbi:Elongation factor Ts [Candidatus Ecksteinia adelgidicola]|nr:Elongation factor Ts [Candidatus Ecksteinia adelgidicola]